ncbi:DNA topoisomerase (ATP-hydrolyzing) KNAG_0D04680 [Huiozyma naganishii CBS 8797]|uniref:DNA topoisomerase (ATP-hydrolyzing) n=1 Tax=Huiozyma naganishii (strain ATCC MYA-139 / BCRC 22969 / CBS 8797 / KCTC 17520 / NBRC 10181 / NCYC 3082 / Yp74L-3) TaxID=1071383 RepID=J7RL29_HUIN7|nr:hypothetical protein KNAG_0D04680 [Kazachstania naganishii CBS 8797]CCK70208.1 hypothetical protein KNAG_0D04680 [Kazachstania naganishii CBS 8797]
MRDLSQLLQSSPSKSELIQMLEPAVREVHLNAGNGLGGIPSWIHELLSLCSRAIEQHGETVQLIVATPRRRVLLLPFCGRSGDEQQVHWNLRRVAVLLALLRVVQQRVAQGETSTTRDVYYSNVELFRNQETVTGTLKVLQTAFQLKSLADLNVVPAQKGLVFSTCPITLRWARRTPVSLCLNPMESHLIPYLDERTTLTLPQDGTGVTVVILEKEAVYNKLVRCTRVGDPRLHRILVTGKGYPDNLTRRFISLVPETVQVHVFVDADPYGINIALKYMDACPQVKVQYAGATLTKLLHREGTTLLALNERDTVLVRTTLQRIANSPADTAQTHQLKCQLQRQLFYGKKAEMNALYSTTDHRQKPTGPSPSPSLTTAASSLK